MTKATRSYSYRIYPSKKQTANLNSQLMLCKELHNTVLGICREYYRTSKEPINRTKIFRFIKEVKDRDDRFMSIHSQVLQNVGDRLRKSYENFFRRLKKKKLDISLKVGFPRFKNSYASITYPQSGFKIVSVNRIYASKIGNIPAIIHRVPEGRIKTMTIKRKPSGKWIIFFNCEIDLQEAVHKNISNEVGIDVGIENFATLSNGMKICNPKFLVKSECILSKYHRRLSRKSINSSNRLKARIKLSKLYEKVTNQRLDFLHKTSSLLAIEYGLMGVESFGVKRLTKNHSLARSIIDASWYEFMQMLDYKASSAGGKVVFVNSRGTSQTCSRCGNYAHKDLGERWHKCDFCGLSLHRDLNSAIEILNRATGGRPGSKAFGDSVRPIGAAVDELGTKRVEIDAGKHSDVKDATSPAL